MIPAFGFSKELKCIEDSLYFSSFAILLVGLLRESIETDYYFAQTCLDESEGEFAVDGLCVSRDDSYHSPFICQCYIFRQLLIEGGFALKEELHSMRFFSAFIENGA